MTEVAENSDKESTRNVDNSMPTSIILDYRKEQLEIDFLSSLKRFGVEQKIIDKFDENPVIEFIVLCDWFDLICAIERRWVLCR